MPERALHKELPDQIEKWANYATSACDSLRAKSPPPEPGQDGLFDSAGVIEIAGRRQCSVTIHSDLLLTVMAKAPIPLVALAPGRWDPVAILSACTRAQRRTAFEVDEDTVIPENEGGLNEIRIARVVGADGLRPYLVRPGRYDIDDETAAPGMPTFAFLSLITGEGRESYVTRRALRALEDVGLARIELGLGGGMATATIAWTERAYLRPFLNQDEHDAIDQIAAGLA